MSEFYSNGKGGFRSECKNCHSRYVKNAYLRRKQVVADYKSEKGCAKCGEKRSYVLDLHHRDPEEKDESIARLTSNSTNMEKVFEEMEKCEVLCANCHRAFHYLEGQIGMTLEEFLFE